MRYKIKEIPSEGRIETRPLEGSLLAEAFGDTDVNVDRSSAEVRIELYKAGEEILVRGRLTGTLELPCAACLEPAKVEIAVCTEDGLSAGGRQRRRSGSGDDPLDDSEVGLHDRKEIDLAPALREQLILAVPMSPRCREDCKGLCPDAGATGIKRTVATRLLPPMRFPRWRRSRI